MSERMTDQKRIVYHHLKNQAKPITAIELYSIVIEELPNLAMSTVYRILQSSVNTGRIARTTDNEGEFLFSYQSNEMKPLIICSECHTLFPITGHALEKLFSTLAKTTGFLFPDLPIQIKGICPSCQAKKIIINKGD